MLTLKTFCLQSGDTICFTLHLWGSTSVSATLGWYCSGIIARNWMKHENVMYI